MTSDYNNQMFKKIQDLIQKCDDLSREIKKEREEHKREKKKLNDKIKYLENKVSSLENENSKLKKEVTRLKNQVNKDSSNSKTINLSKGTLIKWSKNISKKMKLKLEHIEKELLNSYYSHFDESQIKVNGEFYSELCACNDTHTRLLTMKSKKDVYQAFTSI